MQILLTEKEYEELTEGTKPKNCTRKYARELQEFCTKAANSIIDPTCWINTGREESNLIPWGCIITTEEEWYCDECPSRIICEYPHQRYSK